MVAQAGVRFGIANGLIVASLGLAAGVHLTGTQTEFLTVLVAGLACSGLSLLHATGVGVAAWALFTGFVVNRYGALTLSHHDLLRLTTFAVATGLVALAGRLILTSTGERS